MTTTAARVAGPFIGCVHRWCHLVNACEAKAHLIRCWQNLGAVCFWQLIPSGLNLVVAAVLRDCVSCHCCPAWQTIVCFIPCL